VLLVDRAQVPSDIPHGHFIHRRGPARLAAWGLLDPILETNCPAVTSMTADFGDVPLTGHDPIVDGVPLGVASRCSRLDAVLIEAAIAAGVELRDRFPVVGYTREGDRVTGIVGRDARTGARATERADVVVGADGRRREARAHSRRRRRAPRLTARRSTRRARARHHACDAAG